MHLSETSPLHPASEEHRTVKFLDRLCRKVLFEKLSSLEKGAIEIEEAFDGVQSITHRFGTASKSHPLVGKMRILDPGAYSRMVLAGSIGAGESYFMKEWDTHEITDLIRILLQNRKTMNAIDRGFSTIANPVQKLIHRFRKNTVKGARKNVQAHYDLGNDFFELFLDESYLYSSAVYLKDEMTLHEAQVEKIDRICRKLDLKPSDHLIEIGTGWGGFAIHAAKHYGCKVTTTTISKAQHELAKARIEKEGLTGQIELLFEDYRHLTGQYDKLVSIEMIEAVGLDHLDAYFNKCSELLKPDGQALIQAITIREEHYEAARRGVDFIQRYIFPGTGICSIGSIMKAVAGETDLSLVHSEDFGPDYARTLKEWSNRLRENHEELLKRGYSEELYRMWQFYFSYCEGGFLERSIGVSQLLFSKPESRSRPLTQSFKGVSS